MRAASTVDTASPVDVTQELPLGGEDELLVQRPVSSGSLRGAGRQGAFGG